MTWTPDTVIATIAVLGLLWRIGAAINSRLQRIEDLLADLRADTVTHAVCHARREACPCNQGVSDHETRLRALEKGISA